MSVHGSPLFKAQDLSLIFCLSGSKVFKDPVQILYVNLCISKDSVELETLVLGTRITLNDLLFEKIFDTKFSGMVSFMNRTWSENFEVSFEEIKAAVAEPEANLSNFKPLSLCFKHKILAHIIATTLIPRKGSLSNVTSRDMFVLYYMIKRYKINWALWLREYIVESTVDTHASASLPYGLLKL